MKVEESLITPLTDHEIDSMRGRWSNLDDWRAGKASLDPTTVLVSRFLATIDDLRARLTPVSVPDLFEESNA